MGGGGWGVGRAVLSGAQRGVGEVCAVEKGGYARCIRREGGKEIEICTGQI